MECQASPTGGYGSIRVVFDGSPACELDVANTVDANFIVAKGFSTASRQTAATQSQKEDSKEKFFCHGSHN